jgi:hypothetical protein
MMKNGQLTISRFGFITTCRKSDVMRKERTEHNHLRMSLAGTLTGLYIFLILYIIGQISSQ